ncbi:MAG TPA: hypothetical protein VF753_04070 [Terriglobales bacterium]
MPKRICVICSEEFELTPNKPGFANRCPACSEEDEDPAAKQASGNKKVDAQQNEARRKAMRDLLYRKDS